MNDKLAFNTMFIARRAAFFYCPGEKWRLGWAKIEDQAKLSECHVLYVGRSVRHRLGEILAALREQPVLVVSDIRNFASEGGMIGFVFIQGRIVFEINRDALKRGELKASAKLLKLARIVESRVAARNR